MFDLLVWAFWFIFGAYSFWFFTQAKTYQPLTLEDLALTWRLHKENTGCRASRINSILTRNDEVIGYKCDCGHEFLQRRLITQKVRAHVPTRPPQETRVSPQNLGFHYSSIREI